MVGRQTEKARWPSCVRVRRTMAARDVVYNDTEQKQQVNFYRFFYTASLFTCEVVYAWFCDTTGIVWGIAKQIVTDVIGDYWKLFPQSGIYYPPPLASGNISNFGEIIGNSVSWGHYCDLVYTSRDAISTNCMARMTCYCLDAVIFQYKTINNDSKLLKIDVRFRR